MAMQGPLQFPSLPRDQLRILLLGPGESQPRDLAKRQRILETLHQNGFDSAQLGEEKIGRDTPIPLQMAILAAVKDTDLILVLETGPAPLAELTALSLNFKAREITQVWWKREHAAEQRSTPSDVVLTFTNYRFSQTEFENCDLTVDFVDAAKRTCLKKAISEGLLSDILIPPKDQ